MPLESPDALVIEADAPEAEEAASTVRCEITSRGPRVIIPIGGEEWWVSTDRARRLRDELTLALRGLER